MIAAHREVASSRAQLDVVLEVDGLEDRAQLVVAVLPRAQDLEAEVDLRERRDAEHACAHRAPHSRRASAASIAR